MRMSQQGTDATGFIDDSRIGRAQHCRAADPDRTTDPLKPE